MQPKADKGKVTFRMTQAENRQFRNVGFLARFASGSLRASDPERADRLEAAAVELLAFADEFTPPVAKAKNDRQDGQEPEVSTRQEGAVPGLDPLNSEGLV